MRLMRCGNRIVLDDMEHVAAVVVVDARGVVTGWSEGARLLTGYTADEVVLRPIRDRALICEVSDGSSTSRHLRRAHAFDEGGRGLLLVAQLTQRWGSRQTGRGKTIWAEQSLPPE